MLFAIQSLWHLLIISKDIKSKLVAQYKPFALKNGEPTVMGISFYMGDVKYIYEITYNETSVISEKLEFINRIRKALFYERSYEKKISFGNTLGLSKNSAKTLISNILQNHSVLSTFSKVKIDEENTEFEKLFHWIEKYVHQIDEHSKSLSIAMETEIDSNLKKFIVEALSVSDFNITNFEIVEELEDDWLVINELNINPSIFSDVKINNLYKKSVKKIQLTHSSSKGNFSLKMEQESLGTIEYFRLARKIYDLTHNNCIYLIDELEDSLHYDLMLNELLRF